jgi:hypothetical protein
MDPLRVNPRRKDKKFEYKLILKITCLLNNGLRALREVLSYYRNCIYEKGKYNFESYLKTSLNALNPLIHTILSMIFLKIFP